MPYCPSCGYEYTRGIMNCPDCGEELVASEPTFCDNCDEQIDADAQYCPHCGIVFEKDEVESPIHCETHPTVTAVGVCIICGKPVCRDCATSKKGKVFCENDEHVKIHQKWAVLCSTSAEYEAEMVRANLEIAGIKALVFSQVDHAYFIPMSRLAIVNVMVPKEKLGKAREVLHRLKGVEEGDEFLDDEE
ncbi:MAG: zinc ribbon domain-containing protein [Bacteroidota bacterium]